MMRDFTSLMTDLELQAATNSTFKFNEFCETQLAQLVKADFNRQYFDLRDKAIQAYTKDPTKTANAVSALSASLEDVVADTP